MRIRVPIGCVLVQMNASMTSATTTNNIVLYASREVQTLFSEESRDRREAK